MISNIFNLPVRSRVHTAKVKVTFEDGFKTSFSVQLVRDNQGNHTISVSECERVAAGLWKVANLSSTSAENNLTRRFQRLLGNDTEAPKKTPVIVPGIKSMKVDGTPVPLSNKNKVA